MNPTATTDAERAAALDRLLLDYVLAVAAMRRLQKSRKLHEPMSIAQARAAAEDEVDSQTELLLMPKPQ